MNPIADELQRGEVKPSPIPVRPVARFLLILGVLSVAFVWAYWETAASLVKTWSRRSVYSHGFFVVPFAGWLLWRRMQMSNWNLGKPHLSGLALILTACILRWLGTTYFYNILATLSVLPAVAGMVIVAGGQAALRWSWPAILVLAFMIPLPFQLETALQGPLRSVGTSATVYFMQSAGLDVVAEGHVIVSDQMRIGVEEACSGLSILLTFLFLSTAVVLVSRPSAGESVVILLSAIPIALISNVLRITVVGALYQFEEPNLAELVHDHAAFLMMPAALGMLWAETVLLSHLLVEEVPHPIGLLWDQSLAAATLPDSRTGRTGPAAVPQEQPARTASPLWKTQTNEAREETHSWRTTTMIAPR